MKAPTVGSITLEHYPGMTEKSLAAIAEQAKTRWKLLDVLIIHRVGTLAPTDQIVLVVTTSSHRGDAFAACQFVMDYLKTDAPFWKKETTGDGMRWVDARDSDTQRARALEVGSSVERDRVDQIERSRRARTTDQRKSPADLIIQRDVRRGARDRLLERQIQIVAQAFADRDEIARRGGSGRAAQRAGDGFAWQYRRAVLPRPQADLIDAERLHQAGAGAVDLASEQRARSGG